MEPRTAAALGGLYTAAVSFWWLASTGVAIGKGVDASPIAASGIAALWIGRALILCVLALRLGASRLNPRPLSLVITVSWPVLALMAQAADVRISDLASGEVVLVVGAAVLSLLGAALGRVPVVRMAPGGCATLIGIIGAVALWQFRSEFLTWLAP